MAPYCWRLEGREGRLYFINTSHKTIITQYMHYLIFFIHKTKTSCEIQNEPTKAEMYMKEAATCEYATGNGIGDYMTSCAKVHCKLRGWIV